MRQPDYQLIVYGGTPAGLLAAVQAAKRGVRTLVVEPSVTIGGMLTSGLNATDVMSPSFLSPPAREFYDRVADWYKEHAEPAEPWHATPHFGTREWRPEPKVCAAVFAEMVEEAGVKTLVGRRIERLVKRDARILSAQLDDGTVLTADMWIDASYEGDLLPLAEVDYAIGREARDEYGESLAGQQVPHPFFKAIPDIKLPRARNYELFQDAGDVEPGAPHRSIMGWNLRLTLTDNPDNVVPLPEPDHWSPDHAALLETLTTALAPRRIKIISDNGSRVSMPYFRFCRIGGGKMDMNASGMCPIDLPVLPNLYMEGDAQARRTIEGRYRDLTLQTLWHMRTHPTVPELARNFLSRFGLCRDEYPESGNLPPRIYVREGRRLRAEKVLTQNDLVDRIDQVDPASGVGLGRYKLDSKACRWLVGPDDLLLREGMFISHTTSAFAMPYEIMVPKAHQAENLLVPVAASASHVAYACLRMEPHLMVLGAAAGIAAAMSLTRGRRLHDIGNVEIVALYSGPVGMADDTPDVEAEELQAPPPKRSARGAIRAMLSRIAAPSVARKSAEPTLWIHAGSPKTGTTSLQKGFHAARAKLLKAGILYPQKAMNPTLKAHHNLAYELGAGWQSGNGFDPVLGGWADIREEARRTGAAHTVVSSEALWLLDESGVRKVRELAGERAKVVFYLRRQDSYLVSAYYQSRKSTDNLPPFETFAARSLHKVNYLNLLERWAGVFGDDALVVRPFERGQMQGSITDDFLSVIAPGFKAGDIAPLRTNTSPTPLMMAFLARLRRLMAEAGEDRELTAREYRAFLIRFNKVRSPDTRPAALTTTEERRKIVAAVSGSNEAVARRFLGRKDGQLFRDEPNDGEYGTPVPDDAITPQQAAAIESFRRNLSAG